MIGSYIHGSPDNWEGRVDLVKDSYMIVDAKYSGAHSENIYICGATAIVDHSTLYNESDETSLIFGDGICGKGNTVSVTNSMLAGGGYMLQPNAKGVSAPVTITGNRVGRCRHRGPPGILGRLRMRRRGRLQRLLAARGPLRDLRRPGQQRDLVGQRLGRQRAGGLRERPAAGAPAPGLSQAPIPALLRMPA